MNGERSRTNNSGRGLDRSLPQAPREAKAKACLVASKKAKANLKLKVTDVCQEGRAGDWVPLRETGTYAKLRGLRAVLVVVEWRGPRF